ncbi:MAG: hypothetical protein ABJP87_00630, partial [Bauldia litoralis]|uniref:hypothetical protein n=1 Tax=Bauldia litoralis TaxID=665467 RepID=UPI003297B1CA
MSHAFVTVAIPFEAARTTAVETRLAELGNPASDTIRDKLDEAAFVHFMSLWVVAGGVEGPSHLIIEVNADGTVGDVTRKLAATMDAALTGVLGEAGVSLGGQDLATFLERHHQGVGQGWFETPGVNFDGTPGLTVSQIRQEADLARRVADMLDETEKGRTALEVLTGVRDRLWNDESSKWAFTAAPAPSLDPMPSSSGAVLPILMSVASHFLWPVLVLAVLVLVVVWALGGFALAAWVTVLVLVAAVVGMGLIYRGLRRAEEADIPEDIPPSPERVAAYMQREGHSGQSHLAAVSTVKPGRLRHLTLRLGLWFAGILAVHFSHRQKK